MGVFFVEGDLLERMSVIEFENDTRPCSGRKRLGRGNIENGLCVGRL